MNLVDIVRRKDCALTAGSPGVEPGVRVCAGQKMQTVELPAGCSLRLSRILEFRGLQSFPSDLDCDDVWHEVGLIDRGWFDGHFIAGARNHKDFALVLFKGSRPR